MSNITWKLIMSSDKVHPLVSVFMITYNHEKYISQAIEGVLMQKTNFDFELVIGEDKSTDKTREICEKYASKYQNKIKLLPSDKHYGAMDNHNRTFKACTGKYIAMCEGDDYWTDPYKLQKQVDFLEKNPDYGMVCTDYNKFYQQSGIFKKNCFSIKKYESEVKFDDYILDRSTIGTATVLFRKSLYDSYVRDIPDAIMRSFNVGDTPMWLYFALKSRIGVLPDVTAVYRVLRESACHFTSPHQHYSFVMKGFEVPDYFISHFNIPESIKMLNEQKKITATLIYAFKIRDKEIFKNNYNKIKKLKLTIPIKFRFLKLGMINILFYRIIKKLLKLN